MRTTGLVTSEDLDAKIECLVADALHGVGSLVFDAHAILAQFLPRIVHHVLQRQAVGRSSEDGFRERASP